MGHRTYLIRYSGNSFEELFEANNSIPFFWLTLINEKDIEIKIPEMKMAYSLWDNPEAYEAYEDKNSESTNIVVDKANALNNARSALPFIQSNFPESAILFNDFITYLNKQLPENGTLQLNIISLAAFSDIDIFIDGLLKQIRAIKQNNCQIVSGYFNGDIRFGLVGYDEFLDDSFKEHSAQYKHAADADAQSVKQGIEQNVQLKRAELKKRRNKAILTLVVGLLFIFFTIIGFKKEGITATVCSCLIIAVAAIWIALVKLISRSRISK